MGKLNLRSRQAEEIITAPALKPWEIRFLSESLVANLWLDWNDFAKSLISISCLGSLTRSGVMIAPRVGVPSNSIDRIRHEFKRYSKGNNPTPAGVDVGPLEPTWAHSVEILPALSGIKPGNEATLLAAFGNATLVGHKRIHLVRNACAHKSRHNRIDVNHLRTTYTTTHYLDPIDIIWGVDKFDPKKIAIFEWIGDLMDIADLATQ